MRQFTGSRSFPSNSAISQYLRVKLSSSFLVVAGADDSELGTLEELTLAGDSQGTVVPANAEGTVKMVASAAITIYDTVYAAASGKVSSTFSPRLIGIALEAASGNNSEIEVLRQEPVQQFGYDNTVADPGDAAAIVVDRDFGVCPLVTGGAETRTLAIPANIGQTFSMCLDTDGGDCVVTVASGINQTGNNTLTFADAGDEITLKAMKEGAALIWRIISNDGVALSTV